MKANTPLWIVLTVALVVGAGCAADFLKVSPGALQADPARVIFARPPSGARSVQATLMLSNTGEAEITLLGVTLEEDDEVSEVSVLDLDDLNSGSVKVAPGARFPVQLGWNVLDAQRDLGRVTITSEAGELVVPFETPDIDPALDVSSSPRGLLAPSKQSLEVSLDYVAPGEVGLVEVELKSVSAAPLTLESVCFVDGAGLCLPGDEAEDAAFLLCGGRVNDPAQCASPSRREPLEQGQSHRLTVFYRPPPGGVDTQVVRILVRSNAAANPTFTIGLEATPCVPGQGDVCGAVCGDGVRDPGEECDDGDQDNDDACNNDCVGCDDPEETLGTACGVCGQGRLVCQQSRVVCQGALGEADLNACGGCEALDGTPGESCGACNAGALVCQGPDALVCRGEQAPNACGGCSNLAQSPGESCDCEVGQGTWACDGQEGLTCGSCDDTVIVEGCQTFARGEQTGLLCDTPGEYVVRLPSGRLDVKLWGGGGSGGNQDNATGGGGGHTRATFMINAGAQLRLLVASGARGLAGGGGASFLYLGDTLLAVAGGGGGGGVDGCSGCVTGGGGGAGGGTTGQPGTMATASTFSFGSGQGGAGGTQSEGGAGGVAEPGFQGSTCVQDGLPGRRGRGGQGGAGNSDCDRGGRAGLMNVGATTSASNGSGGGGGAGYFGGGGGGGRYTYFGGGGGGGSSYVEAAMASFGFVLAQGSRDAPGGRDDEDYAEGVGRGGAPRANNNSPSGGGHGQIILLWR